MATNCGCGAALLSWRDRTCTDCKIANDRERQKRRSAARIPSALRSAVIARDGRVCRYCHKALVEGSGGRYPNRDRLELDHVIPVIRGGLSTIDNLVVCCLGCNRKKQSREVS